MDQVIELIKQSIVNCEKNGDMFILPSLNRTDVRVTETEIGPAGASLYRCEYLIQFNSGEWIKIKYASKDKCRTFEINPDRSVVEVTCSDPSLNFTNSWDERY